MNPCDTLFWSIAIGRAQRESMARLIESAGAVGFLHRFHVLTDAPMDGCECYDWMQLEGDTGFRILVYLRAAIAKLAWATAVFIDPAHRFFSRPRGWRELCARAPMHIPLEGPLELHPDARRVYGISGAEASQLLSAGGIQAPHFLARPALIFIRRAAIDAVLELVQEFRHRTREHGVPVHFGLGLAYAQQMLCGNPAAHLASARRDLWLPVQALEREQRVLLESEVSTMERARRLLSLPSLVYYDPTCDKDTEMAPALSCAADTTP